MEVKYIYFDVANTLLYKPKVYENYYKIIHELNSSISKKEFLENHHKLSELQRFPDQTSENFYHSFNTKLLLLLAIEPSETLLSQIFYSCKNLDWETFEDVDILNQIDLPMGIITNFNSKVENLLSEKIDVPFQNIIISEQLGVQKPDEKIYKTAIEECGFLPQEILYIGDSFYLDYLPSNKLKMQSLLIDRNNFYPKNDFIIDNLAQIVQYL